jgi:hypothetical protein
MLGPALAVGILVLGLAVLGVPVITYLPILLVLACPLMMIFMMRGMGHGGHGDGPHGHDLRDNQAERQTPVGGDQR